MTQDQALTYLREYRRFYCHTFNESSMLWHMNSDYKSLCYRRYLVSMFIHKINNSKVDPIRIVDQFISDLDYILGESDDDHFITHQFAAILEYEAYCILRYLKQKEKME